MKRLVTFLLLLSALYVSSPVQRADAWGLTIEEIINAAGVVRADRVNDVLYNVMKSSELFALLPKQFKAFDFSTLITSNLGSITSFAQEGMSLWESMQSKAYEVRGKLTLWEKYVTGLSASSGAGQFLNGSAGSITDAADSNSYWKKYQSGRSFGTGAMEQGKAVDLFNGVKDIVDKQYNDENYAGFRELGVGSISGSAPAGFFGTMSDGQNTHEVSYARFTAAQFGSDAASEKVNKIVSLLTTAEVIRQRANDRLKEAEKDIKAASEVPTGDGKAQQVITSNYASVSKMKNTTQELYLDLMDLKRVEAELAGQIASMQLPNYSADTYKNFYTRHRLEKK